MQNILLLMLTMQKQKMIMWQFRDEMYLPNDQTIKFTKHKKVSPMQIWTVIVTFNELESSIEEAFIEIFYDGSHETWMMILWSMSYAQKYNIRYKYYLRWISVMTWWCYEDIKKQKKHLKKIEKIDKLKLKLKKIYTLLQEVGEFRNKVAHWFRHEQDRYGQIRTSKSSFWEDWVTIEYVQITRYDIKKYILKIKSLIKFIHRSIELRDDILYRDSI